MVLDMEVIGGLVCNEEHSAHFRHTMLFPLKKPFQPLKSSSWLFCRHWARWARWSRSIARGSRLPFRPEEQFGQHAGEDVCQVLRQRHYTDGVSLCSSTLAAASVWIYQKRIFVFLLARVSYTPIGILQNISKNNGFRLATMLALSLRYHMSVHGSQDPLCK